MLLPEETSARKSCSSWYRARSFFPSGEKLIDEIDEIGCDQRLFQVFPDAGEVVPDVAGVNEGEALRTLAGEDDIRAGEEIEGIDEALLAAPRALGDSLELAEACGEEGHDEIRLSVSEGPQDNAVCLIDLSGHR